MNYALGIEVQPMLAAVTIVAVFTYVFTHAINRATCSQWIASTFFSDKQMIKKLEQLSTERRQSEIARNKLSAQDHYAKWTKLNRNVDKLSQEITELSSQISQKSSLHINNISKVIMILQKAPMYIVRFWYARTPVIVLLQGTPYSLNIPFPLSYILRMPMGQKNTVSAFFWLSAVEAILSTIHTFMRNCYNLSQTSAAVPAPATPVNKSI